MDVYNTKGTSTQETTAGFVELHHAMTTQVALDLPHAVQPALQS